MNDVGCHRISAVPVVPVVCVLILAVMPFLSASAQEQKTQPGVDTALNKHHAPDTVVITPRQTLATLRFESSPVMMPLALELATTPDYYKSIIFQSPGTSPYFGQQQELEGIDLAMPWKLQLARANEHHTLYSILGAVQAGGVAYLAYKHIQKHGWK